MRQLIAVQMTVNPSVLSDGDRPRFLAHHHDQRITLLR